MTPIAESTSLPIHESKGDAVSTLVLLNGPPASGKSTIAALLVAQRPLALNLDIDVVRALLAIGKPDLPTPESPCDGSRSRWPSNISTRATT